MIEFTVKGHKFTVEEKFLDGTFPSSGEAYTLNRYVTSELKKAIVAGEVKTRQEALTFVMGDKCLKLRKAKGTSAGPFDLSDLFTDDDGGAQP